MKKFLGLEVVLGELHYTKILKHYGTIILFTGLWYFISAMIVGAINGDIWKYVQSTEKFYFVQFILLLSGVILGNFSRVGLSLLGDHTFHYPKMDKWFYPLSFILTYLIINEIFGM